MTPTFTLRRLGAPDAAAHRDLRLLGLRGHPEAFGASFEDEAGRPLGWFAERLDADAVWGGWRDGDPDLAGVAGLRVSGAAKARHKGVLWGMFVRPEARGSGLAAALAGRVLEHARGVVEEVRLTVVASNAAALRLYARLGFRPYGVEPRALKVGGEYHDEVLMALRL
jgi:RimJ/RimL family protein N-acetyltransferase